MFVYGLNNLWRDAHIKPLKQNVGVIMFNTSQLCICYCSEAGKYS
jgi:hypothetical protein